MFTVRSNHPPLHLVLFEGLDRRASLPPRPACLPSTLAGDGNGPSGLNLRADFINLNVGVQPHWLLELTPPSVRGGGEAHHCLSCSGSPQTISRRGLSDHPLVRGGEGAQVQTPRHPGLMEGGVRCWVSSASLVPTIPSLRPVSRDQSPDQIDHFHHSFTHT